MKLLTSGSRRLACVWLCYCLVASAPARAGTVQLGQTAPPIKIAEWVRGGPINLDQLRGSNVLVLDFWATTCAPCRYTIPYISELQKKFRDRGVLMVGISSEPADKVKSFLSKLDAPVGYLMATDSNHQTSDAYLKAAGWEELPHAFIVNTDGKLAWHGNATVALEKVLDQLLAGELDIEAAQRSITAEKLTREYFLIVSTGRTNARTAQLGEQIIAEAANYPAILNEFAWKILTDRKLKKRDYDLALRASKAAYEMSGGNEVPIMDTYARSLFQAGKHAEAIEIEKKAIEACKDVRFRPELESVLLRFQRLSKEQPKK